MYYTYILESLIYPNHFYIGSTSDLKRRLLEHNSSKSIHTNKFTPWKIKNYITFADEQKAFLNITIELSSSFNLIGFIVMSISYPKCHSKHHIKDSFA